MLTRSRGSLNASDHRAFDTRKLFRIVKPGTDEDVFGGPVERDNVYLRAYGKRLSGEILIDDLLVGEGSLHEYNLSGGRGTYKIVRVA